LAPRAPVPGSQSQTGNRRVEKSILLSTRLLCAGWLLANLFYAAELALGLYLLAGAIAFGELYRLLSENEQEIERRE